MKKDAAFHTHSKITPYKLSKLMSLPTAYDGAGIFFVKERSNVFY
jgi:hypothetical protein